MAENFLRSMLAGESRAYGFTIAFWGAGVVLSDSFGLPGMFQALSYGVGAVTGFALLALKSFEDATVEVNRSENEYRVLASLHYLASLAPIVIAGGLSRFFTVFPAFFLGGLSVSLTYNILALLEEDLSELIS